VIGINATEKKLLQKLLQFHTSRVKSRQIKNNTNHKKACFHVQAELYLEEAATTRDLNVSSDSELDVPGSSNSIYRDLFKRAEKKNMEQINWREFTRRLLFQ